MFNDEALREVENMDIDRPGTALAPGADEQLQMKNPEDSSFALHPLDASIMHGWCARVCAHRFAITQVRQSAAVAEVTNANGD